MSNTDSPTFNFTVAVNIDVSPPTFTIFDSTGSPTTAPVEVTVNNTQIIYTLVNNTQDLIFVQPDISDDPNNDLSYIISSDGQILTITDSDVDQENICLKLVVAQSNTPSVTYTSPDPTIKNVPPF